LCAHTGEKKLQHQPANRLAEALSEPNLLYTDSDF
jgi:hypothetical protein